MRLNRPKQIFSPLRLLSTNSLLVILLINLPSEAISKVSSTSNKFSCTSSHATADSLSGHSLGAANFDFNVDFSNLAMPDMQTQPPFLHQLHDTPDLDIPAALHMDWASMLVSSGILETSLPVPERVKPVLANHNYSQCSSLYPSVVSAKNAKLEQLQRLRDELRLLEADIAQ